MIPQRRRAADVLAGGGRGSSVRCAEAAHALVEWVGSFRKKWSALTYCAPAFATPDCGVVQNAL